MCDSKLLVILYFVTKGIKNNVKAHVGTYDNTNDVCQYFTICHGISPF